MCKSSICEIMSFFYTTLHLGTLWPLITLIWRNLSHLDVRTLELAEESPVVPEDGHMEPVPVTISNQNVASVWSRRTCYVIAEGTVTVPVPVSIWKESLVGVVNRECGSNWGTVGTRYRCWGSSPLMMRVRIRLLVQSRSESPTYEIAGFIDIYL